MKELIEELRKCGETLVKIANAMSERKCSEEKAASKAEGSAAEEKDKQEEPKKVITLESVRAVLAEKSRNGFTADVKELIRKFGADKLSDIDESKYEAVLAEAEAIK